MKTTALPLLVFVGAWQMLAIVINDNSLPPPLLVVQIFYQEITNGELLHHLGVTMARLTVSFFIAMSLGCAIGIVLGSHKKLDDFFGSWLLIFLNIPALVTIILCYVWFGLVEAAAIGAVVINKLPNVVVTLREGTRALSLDLQEMAACYKFSRTKTIRYVILPQLHPYIMAATRSGLALIWKIILVVELLGRSDGMGYQLHLFFQLFDVASILAYTLAFIATMQIIEWLILQPIDHHANRWKRRKSSHP